ncbi:MAG: hypothetical protein JWM76_3096, partial [Pseudonocardiales bacterium]|nr:hypothetical protein [Pseudonocardiales bacterium]
LRCAYEQAMSAATRSGDLVRARVLLAAFEALPIERRRAMFGRRSVAPAPAFVAASRRPPKRRRTRRPRKWGMSFPIRMLFLFIVVPAFVIALVGSMTNGSWRGTTEPVSQETHGYVAAVPQNAGLSTADVALYVERLNGRDDVSCMPQTMTAFECHASDGTKWSVQGTSMDNLVTSVITPSIYLQSARFDAQAAVSAIRDCRAMQGKIPASFRAPSTPARFICADGAETIYLRPGDSIEYTRESAHSYRLSVTAGDGETVTYDSRTKAYR